MEEPDIELDNYDCRRRPQRGGNVRPMRRSHHADFRRFLSEARRHAQSHLSTWKLAERTVENEPIIQANLIYWASYIKALTHLEYLGTTNDPGRNRR